MFRGKLLKGKLIAVVTNAVIVAVVAVVSLIGFLGGTAVTVSNENPNLY